MTATSEGRPGDVEFLREERSMDPVDGLLPVVKNIYTAPNMETALAFLKDISIVERLVFFVIQTPDGIIGRDVDGIYDAQGNIYIEGANTVPIHHINIVMGASVAFDKLNDKVIALKRDDSGATIICAPTIRQIRELEGVRVIFKYRMLSPCVLYFLFSFKDSENAIYDDDSLSRWLQGNFRRPLFEQLKSMGFVREQIPRINIDANEKDGDITFCVSNEWNAIEGEVLCSYALALESAVAV